GAVSDAPAALQRRIVSTSEAGSGPPTSGIGTPSLGPRSGSILSMTKLSSGSPGATRSRCASFAPWAAAGTSTRFAMAAPALRSSPAEAALAPWQNSVAHVVSKIFFWMSLAKVAPFGVFAPFGFWHTKAKRWLPCAPSTFIASCAFFFAPSGTVTVAGSVQSAPGTALVLNCSSTPEIAPSPGAEEIVICDRSAASQATELAEKQRLARKSQVLSVLSSESQAGSPSLQRAERVNAEPLASFTWRRQRADAEDARASRPSETATRPEARMDRMSFAFFFVLRRAPSRAHRPRSSDGSCRSQGQAAGRRRAASARPRSGRGGPRS